MSHADYHCCCVCDGRLTYGGLDNESKDCICTYCAVKLAQDGIIIRDIKEFMDYISSRQSLDFLHDFLVKYNFKYCYYPNDIDDLVKSKIGSIEEFER